MTVPIHVMGAVGFCRSLQLAAAAKTVYALMHDELWVWPSFVGTNISLQLHDRNVSLQSLSERPRVLRVASLLSDSECDHIIELAKPLMIRSKVRPFHPCDASVVTVVPHRQRRALLATLGSSQPQWQQVTADGVAANEGEVSQSRTSSQARSPPNCHVVHAFVANAAGGTHRHGCRTLTASSTRSAGG